MRKIKVTLEFFSVMLSLSLIITDPYFAIAVFVAIVTHELGHITAAKIKGVEFERIDLGLFGAGLTPKDLLFSYKNEILICVAGPAVNFIFAASGIILYIIFPSVFLMYFILVSAFLGALNMLPIKTFDGGRILLAFLCSFTSVHIAENTLSVTSFIFIFVLWCASVYMLLVAGYGLSIFIFSISLFSRFFVSEYEEIRR